MADNPAISRPAADRILIVEDEENARVGYEALLRRWGYEVLGVGSAEDALARFAEFAPAVLIADVELPGMNGLDMLAAFGDELKDVPAIIITGRGSEERIVAAIEAGAFWYIEKPLKAAVLRSLLDRALGHVRDRRQVVALTRQLRDTGKLGDLVGGIETHARCDARRRAGRAILGIRINHRRNRNGQGSIGADDSSAVPPLRPSIHRHQLLGDSGIINGKRNFRTRAGSVYGSGRAAAGMF